MHNDALLPGKLGKLKLTPVRRGIFLSNGQLDAPLPLNASSHGAYVSAGGILAGMFFQLRKCCI
jgi:hypothetical protein